MIPQMENPPNREKTWAPRISGDKSGRRGGGAGASLLAEEEVLALLGPAARRLGVRDGALVILPPPILLCGPDLVRVDDVAVAAAPDVRGAVAGSASHSEAMLGTRPSVRGFP